MIPVSVADRIFGSNSFVAWRTKVNELVIKLGTLTNADNLENSAAQPTLRCYKFRKGDTGDFSFMEAKAKAGLALFASSFAVHLLWHR
ncbi:hypothetical protein [Accumulibacter sp.]|uniref:hypothetical protein n=1 Tax=Accumulibacter sp. TaxID=2053492 RepID=UPI0028C40942|nr:hypothetical protein [Accumulibacter sp.]